MSDRTFERAVLDWLDDGSDRTPPPAIDAVLLAVKTTPQDRAFLRPRRFITMPTSLRLAAAAALVAVVGYGALSYFGRDLGAGAPAPSSTATRAPTAASTASPSVYTSPSPAVFTSPLYGYTLTTPAGWSATAAGIRWPAETTVEALFMDAFRAPVSQGENFDDVYVAAQAIPEGTSPEEWLLDYAARMAASNRDCKGLPEAWTDAVIDSLSIRRIDLECEGLRLSDVAFVVDSTGYVMTGNRLVIADFLAEFAAGN